MRFLIFALVVLFSGSAFAAGEKIPCMVFKNGKWQPLVKSMKWKKGVKGKGVCVQQTPTQFRIQVDRLTQLDHLKKKTLPILKKKAAAYESLDKSWKRSQTNWNRQVVIYTNLINYNQKEAQVWRKSFLELQKQKAPKKSWLESPVLWFSVGVIATATVTITVALAINAGSK